MERWNMIWHQAMTRAQVGGLACGRNKTVCFDIFSNQSGQSIRLGLDNRYGKKPARIGGMTLIVDGNVFPITMHDAAAFVVAPGESVRTDPLEVPVRAGTWIGVRIWYQSLITTGNGTIEEARCGKGDLTRELHTAELPMDRLQKKYNLYPFIPLLENVEILPDSKDVHAGKSQGGTGKEVSFGQQFAGSRWAHNIVIFGDSITAMNRWTKPLTQRLYKAYGSRYTLLNSGISGNCMLYDVPGLIGPSYGEKGISRFCRDVLEIPDLSVAMLCLGINDMSYYQTKGAETISLNHMIHTTEDWTKQLKARDVRVAAQTITPRCGYPSQQFTPEMEQLRQSYNAWIRSAGIFDMVVDFDAVVRDPEQRDYFHEGWHQGDSLHPNAAGGQKMAEAVDLSQLTGEEEDFPSC